MKLAPSFIKPTRFTKIRRIIAVIGSRDTKDIITVFFCENYRLFSNFAFKINDTIYNDSFPADELKRGWPYRSYHKYKFSFSAISVHS